MIAASTDDNTLRLYNAYDIVYQYSTGSTINKGLQDSTEIPHGGTLLSYAWYPFMSQSDPASCCLIESVRDHPLHLRDISSGRLRASYTAYDAKDILLSASSTVFSQDGTSIYGGYLNHIARFDVQRPGLPVDLQLTTPSRRSRDGIKGIVSCMAAGSSGLACGTFNGHIGLFTDSSGMQSWRVPAEYCGSGLTSLVWAPNNVHLWAGSRQSQHLVAWDIRDLRGPWAVVPRTCRTQQRMFFGFDATGRHLVAGEMDGTITFHDVGDIESQPVRVPAHGDLVAGISTHPYYPLLATASGQRHDESQALLESDNSLRIWAVSANFAEK
ncbi:Telomerase Cajal body protein 1 [Coemansia sp. RSA 1250]|nr:Telomerase Cajal body protein 1 [Coemansia sp. RSA 1250]